MLNYLERGDIGLKRDHTDAKSTAKHKSGVRLGGQVAKINMIMKHAFFFCLLVMFIAGCDEKSRKKFFIKSVKVSKDIRVDWYVNSSISSFAPDYLQISTNNKEPFFVSFYLADINFKNDSLFISLWKNGYEKLDELSLGGIKVLIDTSNGQWNGRESRFGRLKRAGVNVESPHFVDVYCPNGECSSYDTIPSSSK